MQRERGLSRRGQEGVSITTLLLLVLGIVVVVILILGFTGGFGFIFGKINILPGQTLEAVAQSCNVAAANDLKVDYCDTFKKVKIDSKDEYMNCEDSRIQRSIDDPNKGKSWMPCAPINGLTPKQTECIKLIKDKTYSALINGVAITYDSTKPSTDAAITEYCKSVSGLGVTGTS